MSSDESPTPEQDLTPQTPESPPQAPEPTREEVEQTEAIIEQFGQEEEAPSDTLPDSAPQQIKDRTSAEIDSLLGRRAELLEEIAKLSEEKDRLQAEKATRLQETETAIARLIELGVGDLEQRREELQRELAKLERRQETIRQEMRTTFAGTSQELAIRLQGFKDYLIGSLQDLAAAAEQLDFPSPEARPVAPEPSQGEGSRRGEATPEPLFAKQTFGEEQEQIRTILDTYRTYPDYYGPPWQLRRTFEPVHAECVRGWFFAQGGRGAIRSLGSRLQNILIASAIISVLRALYSDRVRCLVLANTPERLGEWRRGLQDCLGIARGDFGPERGVVLFEDPTALAVKAERLQEQKRLPLIIVDEAENQIDLSLLQFPLWLAFAPDPQQSSSYIY